MESRPPLAGKVSTDAAWLRQSPLFVLRGGGSSGFRPLIRLFVPAAVFLLLGAMLAGCGPAAGGTFVVNINRDDHDLRPGDGQCRSHLTLKQCTLRAALEESNALAGPNTITFDLPTAPLGSTTISPRTPLPDITEEVVIDGTTQPGYDGGKPVVVLQGDYLKARDVNGLTVREGVKATILGMQILRFSASGIANRGDLSLEHMELASNQVCGLDTGVPSGLLTVGIRDSAIFENVRSGICAINTQLTLENGAIERNQFSGIHTVGGSLSITGTSVSLNTTADDGGGLMLIATAVVNLDGVKIEGNWADGLGGGIYYEFATGTLTVKDSIIRDNQAVDGGGVYISQGAARLSGTSVVGNKATNNGGGVYLDDFSSPALGVSNALYMENGTQIGQVGHGNVADSDADSHGWGGGVYSKGEFHMSGSWIEGNTGDGVLNDYGTILMEDSAVSENSNCGVNSFTSMVFHTVQIARTKISRNAAAGICSINADLTFTDGSIRDNFSSGISMVGGKLTLIRSTVSGNRNSDSGGGITGTLLTWMDISDSTISGNSADISGGGLYLWGCPAGVFALKNVTISGNRAAKTGGGMEVGQGKVEVNNVTIADNSAGSGGGVFVGAAATVAFANSVLSENSGGNCDGDVGSSGHNLDSDSSCRFAGAGDLSGVSAELDALADNGGPTQTHALLVSSPAIDSADDATCLSADQRGVSRPQGPHCDMGAFESKEPRAATPTLSPSILFDSVTFSTDVIYQGGKICSPREVTIRIHVSDPQAVRSVRWYYRLEEINGLESTTWGAGSSMIPQGDGWYQIVLNAEELSSLADWKGDAWLLVQFVANDEGGAVLARSGVYRQVAVSRCKT